MAPDKEARYTPLYESGELSESEQAKTTVNFWRRSFFCLLVFSIAGFLSLGFLSLQLLSQQSCAAHMVGVVQPYSPAEGHVEYENRRLTADPDTPKFMGKPRPELDEAWHNLLEGTMIRVSEEELQKADNATSVVLKDGGYAAGLGISHNLHCLKRLKQYLYPDYYYSHGEEDWTELESHADHCLEGLRQTIMCQADLSLYTLEWTPHSKVKPTVRVPQPHACVDWSKLHVWMKDRAAIADDMVHPLR